MDRSAALQGLVAGAGQQGFGLPGPSAAMARGLDLASNPAVGLGALLGGIALGALLPGPLAPVAALVRGAFGLLVAVAPYLIFVTVVAAVLGLLQRGAAGRFSAAVIAAFLAGTTLAGLLAIAMLAPLFQLGLAGGATAGAGLGDLGARGFQLALLSPPVTAVWYGALVALGLHAGARSRALRSVCVPTARVLTRLGVEGVELFGRGLRLAFAPLLLAVGIYVPVGAGEALGASEAALAGSSAGAATAATWYFVAVGVHVLVLAVLVAAASLSVCRAARFPLRRFARDYLVYVYPFAWATASSAATIPVNLERARIGLGVRSEVRDFIVPLGATVNRLGSIVSALVLAVIVGTLVGHKPTVLELLVLLPPLVLVITGAPPVILSVLPIPLDAQAAFAAVFFAFGVGLTDQFRTGVNAIGNGLLCLLFERWWPALDPRARPAPSPPERRLAPTRAPR